MPVRLLHVASTSVVALVFLGAAIAELAPAPRVDPGSAPELRGQQASSREGLVQLSFHDAGDSGGFVHVVVRTAAGEASLPFHLAAETTPADTAMLVAERLRAFGVPVLGPAAGGQTLFVDGVQSASVYADGSVLAAIASVDGPVAALRVTPQRAAAKGAKLHVSLSTRSPHDGSRDLSIIGVEVEGPNGAPGASALLHESSAKLGWISERPGGNGWRPIRDKGGREVVGLAAKVGSGGWQVGLEF